MICRCYSLHTHSICLYLSLCKINCACFPICVLAHAMLKIAEKELENNENFHCDLDENHDILLCMFCYLERYLFSGRELNWELRILVSTSLIVL